MAKSPPPPPGEMFAACDQQLHCLLLRAPPVQRYINLLSVRQPLRYTISSCIFWRDHPKPFRKYQQASGFLEVAKISPSEIIRIEIVPWQTCPHPCVACVLEPHREPRGAGETGVQWRIH